VGDRLRLHSTATGARRSFTLKEISWQGQALSQAEAGQTVAVGLPSEAAAGDLLYQVGETTPAGSRSEKKWREILLAAAQPLPLTPLDPAQAAPLLKSRPAAAASRPRPGPPQIYLRVRSLSEALDLHRQGLRHLILELQEEHFTDYLRQVRTAQKLKGLIWQLPTIIFEDALPFYRQALATLLDGGWRAFMVGNLSHLQLLREAVEKVQPKPPPKSRPPAPSGQGGRGGPAGGFPGVLTIYGDYPLHCLNSWAWQAWQELGVAYPTLSVEADGKTIRALVANLPVDKIMAYLYGHLPLMISRVPLPEDKKALRLTSPKGEQFRLSSRRGLTYLVAKFPFLFQKPWRELHSRGLRRLLVDLNFSGLPAAATRTLVQRLLGEEQSTRGLPFNFYRGLE
jgi:putative protease